MKAVLVAIDLLVRVIVEDDATIDQIVDKAASKAVKLSDAEGSVYFAENAEVLGDDEQCPYDPETDK